MRHRTSEHLKIGLGNGDGKAEKKRYAENERQIFRFRERRTDTAADERHRLLRTEREKPHAHGEQQRADEKREQQIGAHRHDTKTQYHNDDEDRQYGYGGLADLFSEHGARFLKSGTFDLFRFLHAHKASFNYLF